jgi:hypothetical protein
VEPAVEGGLSVLSVPDSAAEREWADGLSVARVKERGAQGQPEKRA